MNKLNMHTKNFIDANIEKIFKIFPNCITETIGGDGSIKHMVDFDQLRQELSSSIVDGPQERYQLNWPGKYESLLTANSPISKTLRPCRDESVNFDITKNLFIEGDNLDALKLLQESYLNKVKLIYIDPPYNTGNDFIYNDDFKENITSYSQRTQQVDEYGYRMVTNTESNGRFHSDWLTMMYARIKLARNLLRDDGVIFISIDDGELANLRKICDEIFGESNFSADIAWQKRYTRSNNTVDFTTVVEHLLVYTKSNLFIVNLLPRTEEANSRYTNPDNDSRGPWKGSSFLGPVTPAQRPNLCYPIENPKTKKITRPTSNAWRKSKSEFERLEKDNRLYWGLDGMQDVPSVKMFLSDVRGLTPTNFWDHKYAGNTDQGTNDLQVLFSAKIFNNPKPVTFIKRILEHGTTKNDIVMDFFSGSATTGHAVMSLNAEDGGKRRHILVQIPEKCDEKSESSKLGYKTIAEIGKERLRRAGKQIIDENSGKHDIEHLDVGFRVLKVDSSNMKEVYYTPDSTSQNDIFDQVNNIREDRSPEDLLFQVLIDWGVDISLPIAQETILNKLVFFVANNSLVACFESNISEEFVKKLASFQPLRVVFRDAGFEGDSVRINVEQIFKLLSPNTEMKTI